MERTHPKEPEKQERLSSGTDYPVGGQDTEWDKSGPERPQQVEEREGQFPPQSDDSVSRKDVMISVSMTDNLTESEIT